MTSLILWVPILVLSTPVILDWGTHVISHSWAAYALFFPVVAWRSMEVKPKQPDAALPGFVLILVGAAIQLWAIAAVSVRHGRPGLILCLTGMLLLHGRATWRVLIPLVLSVPIPYAILKPLGLEIAPALADFYAALARLGGTPALGAGRLLELPSNSFYLDHTDVGLSAGLLASGVAWIFSQSQRLGFLQSVCRSGVAGLAGLLVQMIATGTFIAHSTPERFYADRAMRDFGVYAALGLCWLAIELTRKRAPHPAPYAPKVSAQT